MQPSQEKPNTGISEDIPSVSTSTFQMSTLLVKPILKRGRMCETEGCPSFRVSGPKRYCKRHGGGARCQEPGCTKSAISGGERRGVPSFTYCANHGGGNNCTFEGCENASNVGGLCKSHGGKRCTFHKCKTVAQGGSNFCNRHGGGSRCEVPFCITNTQRNKRCKKHKDTHLGSAIWAQPDVDYVGDFPIVSFMHIDTEPQKPPMVEPQTLVPPIGHDFQRQDSMSVSIDKARLQLWQTVKEGWYDGLREVVMQTAPNTWPQVRAILETAGQHRQPIAKLCNSTGCTHPAATTKDVINSKEELQCTLHGLCVECFTNRK